MTESRMISTIVISAMLTSVTGCAKDERRAPMAAAPPPSTTLEVDEQGHTIPSERDLQDVMRAKLAHGQAILEGLALGDFLQIEANARELRALSQRTEWLIHDTRTYIVYSEQFRDIAADLAASAKARRLDSAAADYVRLVNTCVACHEYLRRERLISDMPGEVSMRWP